MNKARFNCIGLLLTVVLNLSNVQGQAPGSSMQAVTIPVRGGKDITARQLRLKRDIICSMVIPGQDRLILLAVNADRYTGKWNTRGKFIGIDLKTGRIAFVRKTAWPEFQITTQAILLQEGNTLRAISVKDGTLRWEKKHTLMRYVNDSLDFWISHTGTFYNIHGGEQQWINRIPNLHTIEQVVSLAPDTLLISASGLHWVQLQQGIVHSYPAVTDRNYAKGRTQNTVMIITGIMASAISGVPMSLSNYAPSMIFRISSNVLVDGNTLYYASRDSLLKLTRSGEHLWSVSLDAKHTGLQQLIDLGDRLVYLNSGNAAGDTRNITTGSPACRIYDKATGTHPVAVNLPDDETNIIDYVQRGDTLILLMPHHLITLNTGEGQPATKFFPLTWRKPSPARLLGDEEVRYMVDTTTGTATRITTGSESAVTVMNARGHGLLVDLRNGNTQAMPETAFCRVYQSATLEVYSSTAETCFLNGAKGKVCCLPEHGSVTKTDVAYIFTGKRNVCLFPNHSFDP